MLEAPPLNGAAELLRDRLHRFVAQRLERQKWAWQCSGF